MIIVSQDKTELINFSNIVRLAVSNNAEPYNILARLSSYKFNRCYAVGQKQAVYQMPEE